MTLKITFSQIDAAQKVVADGVQQMENLTKQILAQAGLSQAAMQAPAGQVTAETYGDLGGGGKALYEALTQLHNDLNALKQVASEGSDEATRAAQAGATSGSPASAAVTSGM